MRAIGALVIVLLAVAAYWPALNGPFLFDDINSIQKNESVLNGAASWPSPMQPRSLTYAMNAAEIRMFGRGTPAFHIDNLIVHLAATALVAVLLGQFGVGGWALFVGVSLFALHPIQTESVAYITGRAELLSGFFMLAGLAAWFRWHRILPCIMLGMAGMASKETALALFVLLPVLVICESGMDRRFWFLLITGACLAYYVSGRLHMGDATVYPGDYWTEQAVVFWRYIGIIFWPVQSVDWDVSVGAVTLRHSAAVAGIIGLAAAGLIWKQLQIGLLVLGTALVPMSMLPMPDVMVEHRMYFPMAGAALLAGILWKQAASYRRTDGYVV